ncbi:MAG: LamG-like jellyroll fold domain-containing protein [Verrucomicrobiota bacterium]
MNTQTSSRTLRKAALVFLALATAGIAGAANIPSGITGLWRFQNTTNLAAATIGNPITFMNAPYGAHFLGPWTDIGVDSWHTKFSDGDIFQESSWNYMAIDPGFSPNGGGSYVNEYTILIDYQQGSGFALTDSNSLFQTSFNGNGSDGDLWIMGDGTIGAGDIGFSTLTIDKTKWHRIVWSVSNGNFFRVYVDGTNYLDAAGQPVDGTYGLYPNRFNLFADDSWKDQWGMVGTIMCWNRALTTAEIAGMGGWIDASASPSPLLFSDTPEIGGVSPANGATNVAPGFSYKASIIDPTGLVDTNTIQVLLDGAPVPATVNVLGAGINVSFSSGGLLRSGSTHTYSLVAGNGSLSVTNSTTFKVQNYTSYEWRFTSGDLSPALGTGIMSYADPFNTPFITSFGTTDGSTVPNINGSPAKYMHVPAFDLDTDGYLLEFVNSGPNVSGSAGINRYTLLMDILVPSTWVKDWIVPFFNTDPYNLNDADFFLALDGSIGIGGGGYSAAGTMAPDTWYRLAFVADLEANTLTYYVNGVNVKSRAADGLEGRWSIYSNQDAGPDLLLFNEGDTPSYYDHELYLASVAFVDRALASDELTGLGGPKSTGILVPSYATKPSLSIAKTGSGATVSWPASYVGYTLEQSDTLVSGSWAPMPGVTNNAVNISAGNTAKFYRLSR